MDNGFNENFSLVYNGAGIPDMRSYTASGLVTGRPYRFYLQALNYAGSSIESPYTTIYACDDPGEISAPEFNGQQSATMIPIKWSPPKTSGGCAITSYAILRNGGPSNPAFVVIHSAAIENKPSLRTFDVTDIPANMLG